MKRMKSERRIECKNRKERKEGRKEGRKEAGARRETDGGSRDAVLSPLRVPQVGP